MLKDIYLKNSGIPKRYLQEVVLTPSDADIQTFKELNDIRLNINQFVKNGQNLLICSNNVGCGKTSWATKLLKAYIDNVANVSFSNNCPALFINVNNFLNEKKLAIEDKELLSKVRTTEQNILSAKLVVFDDIGVKDISQYDMGQLYYWIDERTNNMKSCIFTSNLLPSQLKKALDDRLYSRIVNYSEVKEVKDGDHRRWV